MIGQDLDTILVSGSYRISGTLRQQPYFVCGQVEAVIVVRSTSIAMTVTGDLWPPHVGALQVSSGARGIRVPLLPGMVSTHEP